MRCYNLEEARRFPDQVTELFLHHCGLEQIPPLVFAMPRLQRLHLSENPIQELPPQLSELLSLRVLSLPNNQLARIPASLFRLQQLEKLDLSGNALQSLPPGIARLQQLTTLLLNDNKLSELPEEVGTLQQLQRLEVSVNQLTRLPAALKQLSGLRRLSASRNKIRTLPKALCRFSKLEKLDLSHNRLSGLPEEIGQLAQLSSLQAGHNSIKALPGSVGQLKMLRQLSLERNKLEALPEQLWHLPWLARVNLGRNRLRYLSEEAGYAQRLEVLQLADNQLESLPHCIGKLPQLRRLSVSGNALTALPPLPLQLATLQLNGNPLGQWPEYLSRLYRLEHLEARKAGLENLPNHFRQLSALRELDLRHNPLQGLPEPLYFLPALRQLKGVGDTKSRTKLLRFIRLCESREVPLPLRRLFYEVLENDARSLADFSVSELLQALTVGVSEAAYPVRIHLLRQRSAVSHISLEDKGASVLLLGETGFDPAEVRKALEPHGLRLVTSADQGADYLVLGRLLRLHRLPKMGEARHVISRQSLNALLNEQLGRKMATEFRESQLEKLRLMLFHQDSKNRRLAVQLLRAGGVPPPLITDLFLAWKLDYGPAKALEQLLLQNCSEEALRNLYAPLGLRGRIGSRQLRTHIERYTDGNELDAARIREFLEN